MADIEHITRILKDGIRFGAIERIHPRQLDTAAERLVRGGPVAWEDLEQLGRDLAWDAMLFCEVNIDLLNEVMGHSELAGAPRRRK